MTTPRFDELDIPVQVLAGIVGAGFHQCTPIQARSLPHSLTGRDIVGQAQTGTGKTAAFLITLFSHLLKHPRVYQGKGPAPRALVIAPTRELVVQIEKDAQVLGRETGLKSMVVFGGMNYEKQRAQLADNPDLLIGTPGRLIDYFRQRAYTLEGIEVLVIDEADRMFDMGFIDDIRFMLRRMPPPGVRQTLLFSATFPERVKELAYEHMHEPEQVFVSPERVTADKITETLYFVSNQEKLSLLVGILRGIMDGRTMVFVNTKRTGEDLEYWLEANGIAAQFISGDVPQKKRLRLLEEFKSGALPVLIATDVASRGLHIDDVSHVINYDVPQDAEDYVHRIGRTARAGAEGDAITFGCETYAEYLVGVEEFIGRPLPGSVPEEELYAEVVQPHRRRTRPAGKGPKPAAGRGRERKPRHGGKRASGAGKPTAETRPAPRAEAGGDPAAEGGVAKKRRRRRRRKGGGGTSPSGSGGAPSPPSP